MSEIVITCKPEFKAVFNIFTHQLAVRYGNSISIYQFTDDEEWVKISYNADRNNPYYLHIQQDYDECFQLLFYPRKQGSEDLNESAMSSYNSGGFKSNCIRLVDNDRDFNYMLKDYLNTSDAETIFLL